MIALGAARYRLRLAVARHRRTVLAALIAAAVACGLQAVRPAPSATRPVAVVDRDLPAGHVVSASDVVVRDWPAAVRPSGLLARPVGRVLSGAVRRGEALTDARVAPEAGDPLAGLPPDAVTIAVRLADPAAAAVARPGGRVDVIAGGPLDPLGGTSPGSSTDAWGGTATTPAEDRSAVVVPGALVVTVGHAPDGTGGTGDAVGGGGTGSSGGGVLGGLGDGGGAGADPAGAPGATPVPAGVLVLAVSRPDAVRLAGMTGSRRLTVTAPLQPAGGSWAGSR